VYALCIGRSFGHRRSRLLVGALGDVFAFQTGNAKSEVTLLTNFFHWNTGTQLTETAPTEAGTAGSIGKY
jgi:hypothetical protein